MASDLTPELTKTDWETLSDFRLLRLQSMFADLQLCHLQISCLTNDLLLICDRAAWDKIQPILVDLRMASWAVAAADNLSIFVDGHLTYCAMTQLPQTVEVVTRTLDTIDLRIDPMVTATPTRPRSIKPAEKQLTATPAASNDLPDFIDLMPLAQKSGIPIEHIAAEIKQLGGVAGRDRTGTYITTEDAQRTWVTNYLKRLEADFLLPPQAESVPSVEPTAKAAKPRRARTAAQDNGKVMPKERRLKDFSKAQSYSVTIGRFLDAQGWDGSNPLRAQVFEGIAALPDNFMPKAKGSSLAERSLYKILSKYPASSRAAACKGLIKTARETIGQQPSEQPASRPDTATVE